MAVRLSSKTLQIVGGLYTAAGIRRNAAVVTFMRAEHHLQSSQNRWK
jgi:hypothetical protein